MKKTLTRTSRLKRVRRHGFRRRMASRNGRGVLKRRRQKGRRSLIP